VVVDDAIVVLENIFRHAKRNMRIVKRQQCARRPDGVRGARLDPHPGFHFLPVAFISGIMAASSVRSRCGGDRRARLAVGLAHAHTDAVRPLSGDAKTHGASIEPWKAPSWRSSPAIAAAGTGLAHRWTVVGIALLIVASSAFFFIKVGKTFIPKKTRRASW